MEKHMRGWFNAGPVLPDYVTKPYLNAVKFLAGGDDLVIVSHLRDDSHLVQLHSFDSSIHEDLWWFNRY